MFKIIRVFVGTALGIGIASYFLPGFAIHGPMTYLWATLIVLASVFISRGFNL